MSEIANLITKYKGKDRKLVVTLPEGEKLTFLFPYRFEERMRVKREAVEFARKMLAGTLTKPYLAHRTDDENVAVISSVVASLSHDPKISVLDVLKMKDGWGDLYDQLATKVGAEFLADTQKLEVELIEDLGEGSAQTGSQDSE